jgi:putative FmdB family regulatory protein
MPTYEYACKTCGEHLEVVQSFKDNALTECPACGGSLRKVFGNIGITFKGNGFYRTDSRSDGRRGTHKNAEAKAGEGKASEASSGSGSKGDASSSSGSSSAASGSAGSSSGSKSGSPAVQAAS